MRLPLLPEALDELGAEMLYLESERPGWGYKLLDEVAAIAELATAHQELGEREDSLPESLDIRRFPITRFRCLVIVGLVDGARTIIAVAPGRKEPRYWRDRLTK